MFHLRLIIIGFFLVVMTESAFSATGDYASCECSNGFWEIDSAQSWEQAAEALSGAYSSGSESCSSDYRSFLVGIMDNPSYCQSTDPGDGSCTSWTIDKWHKRNVVDKCVVCNEPDEELQIDGSQWQMSNLQQVNSCNVLESYDIGSECSAIDGTIFTEKINCCVIQTCYLPVEEPVECPATVGDGVPLQITGNSGDASSECTIASVDAGAEVHTYFSPAGGDGSVTCCYFTPFNDDDIDGDGIPNDEDDDIDGDGVLNSSDGTPYGEESSSSVTVCPDILECAMSSSSGNGSFTNLYDVWSCINGTKFSNYAHITKEESFDCFSVVDDCAHSDYLLGYVFQSVVSSPSVCNTLSGGNLQYSDEYMPGCTDGSYACFYNNIVDNDTNTTDDDNNIENNTSVVTDSNVSMTADLNGTGFTIDMSASLSRLDTINKSIGKTNSKIDTINSKLGDINSKLTGMNTNLGGKLDTVNSNLEDIKGSLNPDIEADTTSFDTGFQGAKDAFNNSLASFETTGADIRALTSGLTPPTVSASGDCTLSTSTSKLGSITMDFSVIDNIRPPLQFFLNLVLLFLSLKLYTIIARDIVSYFAGGL